MAGGGGRKGLALLGVLGVAVSLRGFSVEALDEGGVSTTGLAPCSERTLRPREAADLLKQGEKYRGDCCCAQSPGAVGSCRSRGCLFGLPGGGLRRPRWP